MVAYYLFVLITKKLPPEDLDLSFVVLSFPSLSNFDFPLTSDQINLIAQKLGSYKKRITFYWEAEAQITGGFPRQNVYCRYHLAGIAF